MKGIDRLPAVRWAPIAVAVVLAMTACSDGQDGSADPTVPTAPRSSSSSTAATIDVTVVPERIDEAYLNAVLAALDKIDGDATRIIQQAKRLTPDAVDLLNAIYSDDELQAETNNWLASIGEDPEMTGLLPTPANRNTVVERVIAASPGCVWMTARRDYSNVIADPGPVETVHLKLEPLDRSNDPQGANPTPWMITKDRLYEAEPPNPCPSA